MANPEPEITYDLAKQSGAYIVGTGRSDFPNQINNVLVFPGIFKGRAQSTRKGDHRGNEAGLRLTLSQVWLRTTSFPWITLSPALWINPLPTQWLTQLRKNGSRTANNQGGAIQ